MADIVNFNIIPNDDDEEFIVDFGEVINIGSGGTSSFNDLTNRPKYNNQTMTGGTNIPQVPTKTSGLTNDGASGESTYVEANELATVATTGSYNDLDDKPTIPDIPTVNDATLTITQNGEPVGTFTANDADDTTIELADTTYSNFVGTNGGSAGTAGLVPAPSTTDAGKFLKADGTWDTAGGGSSVTVVQTEGTSQTDVMSQKATTEMIYSNSSNYYSINIRGSNGIDVSAGISSVAIGGGCMARGDSAISIGQAARNYAAGAYSVTIGNSSKTDGHSRAVALGNASEAGADNSVAIGTNAKATRVGEVNVGADTSGRGYNSTNYRVIGGVHDGQLAQDAVTVNQVNGVIDAINAALSTNIPHIGASS